MDLNLGNVVFEHHAVIAAGLRVDDSAEAAARDGPAICFYWFSFCLFPHSSFRDCDHGPARQRAEFGGSTKFGSWLAEAQHWGELAGDSP